MSEETAAEIIEKPKKMGAPSPFDWVPIEHDACVNGLTAPELEAKYGIKANTINQHARRNKWPWAHKIIPEIQRRAIAVGAARAVREVAEEWSQRGEDHRNLVFNLAHDSLKKMKPKAPKNFRDAKMADDMARRAAGLETSENVNQTLIQINDSIDDFDAPRPIKEAQVVPTEEQPTDVEASATLTEA